MVDNRPEAVAQRKLQSSLNNSPRVQQLKSLQSNVQRTTAPLQRQTMAPVQRQPFKDAKEQIEKACKGWGTDESGIYDAIRTVDAGDRPKLAADKDVQKWLKDEMGGHDYWKALLLLEYGNEAAFPAAIQEIWGATKGMGTDEQRIYDALAKLPKADALRIAKVPGLSDILDKELGGKDMDAANAYLDGSYADAIQSHKDDIAWAQAELNTMRSSGNPVEENTAEWINPTTAGATPKNDLYLVSSTHDSAARAKEHGKDADYRAYFGKDEAFPDDTGTYDTKISSERNIRYAHKNAGGHHNGRSIWMYDVKSKGSFNFKTVLIHEVQHDADRHDREEGHDDKFKSPEESWNRYKTEFRSYWVDDRYSGDSDANNPAIAPFDNDRQKRIFDLMYNSPLYKDWLQPNYDDNKDIYGGKFQDLIHGYTKPEGVNLVNSPRIDNFFLQLEKCDKGDTDLSKSPLKELEVAANALNVQDRAQVNSSESLRLQEMMKDNLEPTVLAHIAMIVNGGAAPAWANVNISDARKKIEKAGDGWGTDESAIFDAIRSATAAERSVMKTDTTIKRVLYSELDGHDLWKAEILLEYGEEKNWPAAITDVYEATKGWGTDEKKIRQALEKLTRPQVEAIAKVPGLSRILDAELGGLDEQITDDLLDGKYADAIANHQADIAAIDAVVQAGLASADATWKGIATKLNDPAQALIHGMTRTHDSADRATRADKGGQFAHFGHGSPYPSTIGTYDSHPKKNGGIRFVTVGTQQETSGSSLFVYEARNIGAASLKTILETFGKTLP